jgi:hypothetical protein
MDAIMHRIEALPGARRYAVTWLRADGSEQTAVVHLRGEDDNEIDVAPASLPPGCDPGTKLFAAAAGAVQAMDAARRLAPARQLRDVEGGWDVSLGNVTLDSSGAPACTAHGAMHETAPGEFRCDTCGAQALLG